MADLGWEQALLRLVVAFALGLPIGWEREHRAFSPGLRIFPLVGVGACEFLLVGQHAFGHNSEAEARILQGLLGGIGFIGGGAILKGRKVEEVHGLSTAVAIWITAGIGASIAYGLFWMAAFLSLLTLASLRLFSPRRKEPLRS